MFVLAGLASLLREALPVCLSVEECQNVALLFVTVRVRVSLPKYLVKLC